MKKILLVLIGVIVNSLVFAADVSANLAQHCPQLVDSYNKCDVNNISCQNSVVLKCASQMTTMSMQSESKK